MTANEENDLINIESIDIAKIVNNIWETIKNILKILFERTVVKSIKIYKRSKCKRIKKKQMSKIKRILLNRM